jgi:type IV pilus assembly protein PilY1
MRSSSRAVVWVGMLASLAGAASASAQVDDPDIRSIPPFVMVIVDSSGSMEYLPNCQCLLPGCTECLPNCSLPNDAGGNPPALKKNKWATLLESLTGKFDDFQCNSLPRTAANGSTYDLDFELDYHQPWRCSVGQSCAYPGTSTQQANGLLDNYLSRLRFGLMTFDGKPTYQGASDLQFASVFNLNLVASNTEPGSWSYGGPKPVHYPFCDEDYLIDTGVRNASATKGGWISLDGAGCSSPPCDLSTTNAAIQTSLLSTRTFGGTPIAASLDDLAYHFKHDVTDPYATCRNRYAVLITDGEPDDDFRSQGCACGQPGNGPCPGATPPINPNDMKCPYPLAQNAAYALTHDVGTVKAQMQQLFVVGMSIADPTAKHLLNLVASSGNSVDTDGDGNEAFFADNPAALTSTLDTLFGGLSKPVSRSVPAFATGIGGVQYQLSAGFQVSKDRPVAGVAAPWTGLLERKRFTCVNDVATAQTLDSSQGDKFQDVLNSRTSARSLWTALPNSLPNSDPALHTLLEGPLSRGSSTAKCGTTYCDKRDLTSSAVTPLMLNVADPTAKTRVTDWMYGVNGSVRVGKRLGDIYHSSPTIVGASIDDPGDGSYSLFRDSPVVTERPLTMYIGSNDGILHAFSVEAYPATGITLTVNPGVSYRAGEEMWGFVPPLLLGKLNDQITAHKLSMDGTPVVKDVFFHKAGTATATDYHTVLITGMRGGGNAYMALDVTDPVRPQFLWQFTDPNMGKTYGQAEIVQAIYEWPAGSPATIRAMAILPGGVGAHGNGPGCDTTAHTAPAMKVVGTTSTPYQTFKTADDGSAVLDHRKNVQCWTSIGRSLYFVDIETGETIKTIYDDSSLGAETVFPSPIVGSPAAYQDTVGTVATEGFVMDADGVLWRIDLTDTNPHPNEAFLGWTVRPFHDLFWDNTSDVTDSETTYERPILSLDEHRRLVVITGTGDNDNFDKPNVHNRLVSLTEMPLTAIPTGPADYKAALNWEQRDGTYGFVKSELVTGTMALFEGQLYVASFISVVDNNNSCDAGRGRLWAFSYNLPDKARPNGSLGTLAPLWLTKPTGSATNTADSGAALFNIDVDHAEPNLLVQGLGATQRLTCQSTTTPLSNYFAQTGLADIRQSGPPTVWIVAQASSNNAARNRAGSTLGSLEMQINRPLTFSRVISWAGSVD